MIFFKYHQMTGTTQQNTKTPQVHIPAASAAGNSSVSVTLDPQAQLESDKRAVYRLVTFFMRYLCVTVKAISQSENTNMTRAKKQRKTMLFFSVFFALII